MIQKEKLGAVFDCNVFFQATRNATGPAASALRLFEAGAFSLFLSNAILEEIRETFTDPDIRAKNRWLTNEVVDALFKHLESSATLIQDVTEQFSYERDPDDAKYVNLALAAGAKYLVTRDKDLLDLMSDETFRKEYPHLTILDPVAFLQQLPREDKPEPPAGKKE
jgi:putative PIN family toxin of toxin-antitoxin system